MKQGTAVPSVKQVRLGDVEPAGHGGVRHGEGTRRCHVGNVDCPVQQVEGPHRQWLRKASCYAQRDRWNSAGCDQLLCSQFGFVVDIPGQRRELLVHPDRTVGGNQGMSAHARTADVENTPDAEAGSIVEQARCHIDVDGAEFFIGLAADVRGVQCGSVDQGIGPLQCSQLHGAVPQVSDDTRPAAGNPVDAADHPACGVECRARAAPTRPELPVTATSRRALSSSFAAPCTRSTVRRGTNPLRWHSWPTMIVLTGSPVRQLLTAV